MGDEFNLTLALWGALGGALPDFSRTVAGFRHGEFDRWRDFLTAGYWVSSLGLGVLGFIVVAGLGATSMWSAIVTGAAAPALLSNAIGQRQREPVAETQTTADPTKLAVARWAR